MSTNQQISSEEHEAEEIIYTTNITFLLHYSDGKILQLDKDITWGKLQREGLEAIEVYRKDKGLIFQLFLEPDQKLIYTRRTMLRAGEDPFSFYILGWRKNIAGQDVQSINLIYEDGETIQQLPRFRQEIPFHAPDFNEAEK